MTAVRGEGSVRRPAMWLADVRRAVLWHRRLLAAGLAAGAVGAALIVVAPDPPRLVPVLAAARDLAPGAVLRPDDIATVALPPPAVPDAAIRPDTSLEGRVLAGPVRRGEPLTDVRFVGGSLVASLGDGLVATPVRIADAGAAALLQPGDLIDVIAATQPQSVVGDAAIAVSRVVASGVRVVTVPSAESDAGLGPAGLDAGALVVLATTSDTAAELASAAVDGRLSLIVRPS